MFKLTDGRPWYKQVITGVALFVCKALELLGILMAGFVAYCVYKATEGIPVYIAAEFLVLCLVGSLGAILSAFLVWLLYVWASDET